MLKVIGAGFGRTGTASAKFALERIGFGPCYHMKELFSNPSHVEGWRRAAAGEQIAWEELLGGYRSAVDWPAAAFWRELMRAYPDAAVLLTTRDPDEWYDSAARTIYSPDRLDSSALPTAARERFEGDPRLRQQPQLMEELIWQGIFGGRFEERSHAVSVYRAHAEEVRAAVPADRLLEWDVASGWTPLCAFLRVPVPVDPFPHLNTSAAFRARLTGE